MTTEAAFIVHIQHEYLRDAHARVAACLQELPSTTASYEAVLRQAWQMTHALKGEAQVVGFVSFAGHLEVVENALGHVRDAIDTAGTGPSPTPIAPEALARLASALREVCYGLEAYLRALERNYTDAPELAQERQSDAAALTSWEVAPDADWGMGAVPTGDSTHAAPAPALDDLGPGITFDSDVFLAHVAPGSPRAEAPKAAAPAPVLVTAPAPVITAAPAPIVVPVQPPVARASSLFLMVRHGGTDFAVPLSQVVEIVECRRWNPLPVARRNILGVINLRGAVLPILDFRAATGAVAGGESRPRCIVVLDVEGRRFGIGVESVSHVTEVRQATLQPIGDAGVGSLGTPLTQMGLVEGRTVLFLDMARMVA